MVFLYGLLILPPLTESCIYSDGHLEQKNTHFISHKSLLIALRRIKLDAQLWRNQKIVQYVVQEDILES